VSGLRLRSEAGLLQAFRAGQITDHILNDVVVLIVIAYGPPIWNHLQMTRFGSPGFSPF